MEPLKCYKTYLALKNHFTKSDYDFHKYNGEVRATLQSLYKRKDRYFFEKLSRKKTDKEVVDFFVSNIVFGDESKSLWVGDLIKEGENTYQAWLKKIQSLKELFCTEIREIFSKNIFDDVFKIKRNKHPILLKYYLQQKISIETLIILNSILDYQKEFDSKLKFDPIWESISMRITKYSPFLNLNIFEYKRLLKQCVLDKNNDL